MFEKGVIGVRSLRFAVLAFGVATAALFAGAAVGTVAAQEDVSSAQDIDDIRDDLDGNYVLTDDIDLSGTENFEPIGVFNDPFTGTFDGNGHNITGLTIERLDDDGVGLFGDTGASATIRNVTLKEVSVDGKQWVGALVGFNKGDVEDSYATGDVIADTRAGGLVGGNQGRITQSYAQGTVTSVDITGGLVGRNEGDISESYANASVSGFSGVTARDMGGLVGVNIGDIEDSYARGEVLGDEFVGGLVGASSGDIVGSYATSRIDGDSDTGGLVGDLNFGGGGATLRNSYWDEDTTGQTDAVGAQTGSPTVTSVDGLQTSEMRGDAAETNMDAFDFPNTWATVTDPDDYPVLAWQVDGDLFTRPLPEFRPGGAPPTNTQELNTTLYEDVNGDGDGLDPSEAVNWWSDLVQNPGNYNSLTQAQVDALDWSGDGNLTPSDAVALWSEKVQNQP